MVAGIVFLALGLKKVIKYVADTEKHSLSDALTGVPLVTAALLVALVPVAWQLPALVSLGLLAVVLVSLIGYEATVHAEARHAVRHGEGPC